MDATESDAGPRHRDAHGHRDPGANGARSVDDADRSAAAGSVREDLREMWDAFGTLAALQVEQARLAAADSVRRGLGLILLWLAAAAVAITCVVALLRGVVGGLAAATGRPWLGELLTGVLGLGVLAAIWVLGARRRDAREVRRLEQRFGPLDEDRPDEPRAEPGPGPGPAPDRDRPDADRTPGFPA